MAVISRGSGKTPSERYLARLAEQTFLDLWSYPNVYNDKRPQPAAQGQELCDLLVVCDPYVLIFSDKHVDWPGDDDIGLSWKRWYKRAIKHSIKQLRGAERWIATYPNRIFIDPDCKEELPVALPPSDRRIVHGIVVAGDIREACIRFFKGGIGSLAIDARIKGDNEILEGNSQPFTVGDPDPDGSFVHIFDQVSLDIVLSELDTIADFADYLDKKAALFRSGRFAIAQGEEDLMAYYMTRMNADEEHDFTRDDGSNWEDGEQFAIDFGVYGRLRKNERYVSKKKADEPSYLWDRLIGAFTRPMLEGTTVVYDEKGFDLARYEVGVRKMALVPRLVRRIYGLGILEAMEESDKSPRFARAFMPMREAQDVETGFFFMTLACPDPLPPGGYEQYRKVRLNMLRTYGMAHLRQEPRITEIVGIATEPLHSDRAEGRSEDLLYAEQPEWTPELIANLEQDQETFDVMRPERIKKRHFYGDEFPDVPKRPARNPFVSKPLYPINRQQRRAAKARARRKR